MSLAVVILAAGASTRMGRCKALIEIEGEPIVARLARLASGAMKDPTSDEPPPPLVVTGADHEPIRAALPGEVDVARNPDWQDGRTGSAAYGQAERRGYDLLIAPIDHPLVGSDVFRALVAAWSKADAPASGWLAPFVRRGAERSFGHPLIIGRELAAELAKLLPDAPLRDLRRRAQPLLATEVDSPEILANLDRPEDWEQFSAP